VMAVDTTDMDRDLFGNKLPAAVRARYKPPTLGSTPDTVRKPTPSTMDGDDPWERQAHYGGRSMMYYTIKTGAGDVLHGTSTRPGKTVEDVVREAGGFKNPESREIATFALRDAGVSLEEIHALGLGPRPVAQGAAPDAGARARTPEPQARAPERAAPQDPRDAPPKNEAANKAEIFNKAAGQVDPGVITQDLFKEFQADLNKKLIDGQKIDVDGKTGSFTRDAFRMFLTQNKGNEAVLKPLLTKHAAAVQWLVAKEGVSPGKIDGKYGIKTETAVEKWMGEDYDLSIAETGTAPGASAPAPR
jgi:hypothetical protein